MIKKTLLIVGIVGLAIGVAKSIKYVKHSRHEFSSLVEWAESKIPLEKKFAMLRRDAESLDKDIDKVKNELAREIVEVRELTTKTGELRASIDVAAKDLVARGEAINDATTKVSFGNKTMSVSEAKARLQKDVATHLKNVKRLELMEKTLGHREQIRDTLQKTLDGMIAKKAEALAAIDELEAEYKELQLTQVESKYQTDDTRLAKIKETLQKIRKDVEVEKEVLNLTPRVMEESYGETTDGKSIEEILAPVKAKQ